MAPRPLHATIIRDSGQAGLTYHTLGVKPGRHEGAAVYERINEYHR